MIHTASPAHGLGKEIYELVNITGTENVIASCQESDTVRKLVYTSSGGVIYNGEQEIICADERIEFPEKALDAYNETKVAGEKLVLAANGYDLLTCALRPAGIFGPGDRQMISGFYQVVLNNQTRFQIGDNNNLADFTYVGNVAYAHLLAVDKLETKYSYINFRDPLNDIDISLGSHRIPTSDARPLGPKTSPSEADREAAKRFETGEYREEDLRPVLRSRMDAFVEQANKEDEDTGGEQVAGQAFFITNGEPVYFWDFTRTIWRNLGHVPPPIWSIPTSLGDLIATVAEYVSWFTGKEPGFTRFRVAQATLNRNYDIEKARRLLGYEPLVGLDEGMKRWTDWYKGELEKQNLVQESEKTK